MKRLPFYNIIETEYMSVTTAIKEGRIEGLIVRSPQTSTLILHYPIKIVPLPPDPRISNKTEKNYKTSSNFYRVQQTSKRNHVRNNKKDAINLAQDLLATVAESLRSARGHRIAVSINKQDHRGLRRN